MQRIWRLVTVTMFTFGSPAGCDRRDASRAPPAEPGPQTEASANETATQPSRPLAPVAVPSTGPDKLGAAFAAGRKLLGPKDHPAADEVEAAINRVIPADVREKRRKPTDRERLALTFMLFLAGATNGPDDGRVEAERATRVEAKAALEARLAEARRKHAGASPELREEWATVERLMKESASLHDFLNRPTTFPSEQESLRDLARRIDQIPDVVDRSVTLERDAEYHGKRLELLTEMEPLRADAKQAGAGSEAARKLAAQQELLAALDEQYRARVRLDELSEPSSRPSATAPVDDQP